MAVNGEKIDTFSSTVQWDATMALELSDADTQSGKHLHDGIWKQEQQGLA